MNNLLIVSGASLLFLGMMIGIASSEPQTITKYVTINIPKRVSTIKGPYVDPNDSSVGHLGGKRKIRSKRKLL